MSPTRGYYSLIQFCPNLGRREAANIGVLLFCPDRSYLRARMSADNRRVRRFFGSAAYDVDLMNSFKRGVENRLEVEGGAIRTLADLETFIALRANAIQMTPPRPVKVLVPDDDLDRLFRELVGGPAKARRGPALTAYLDRKFATPGIAEKVRRDLVVRVPILQRDLEIPYGFQNGRFNLIRPARFLSDDSNNAVNTASRYAVEGQSIYESPDPRLGQLKLIVVGDFGANKAESLPLVRRILAPHHVDLYELEKVDSLVEEIRRTGREAPAGSEG